MGERRSEGVWGRWRKMNRGRSGERRGASRSARRATRHEREGSGAVRGAAHGARRVMNRGRSGNGCAVRRKRVARCAWRAARHERGGSGAVRGAAQPEYTAAAATLSTARRRRRRDPLHSSAAPAQAGPAGAGASPQRWRQDESLLDASWPGSSLSRLRTNAGPRRSQSAAQWSTSAGESQPRAGGTTRPPLSSLQPGQMGQPLPPRRVVSAGRRRFASPGHGGLQPAVTYYDAESPRPPALRPWPRPLPVSERIFWVFR